MWTTVALYGAGGFPAWVEEIVVAGAVALYVDSSG